MIVDRTEDIPPIVATRATPAQRAAAELQWINYIQYHEDIAAAIYNAYSVGIYIYIDDIDNPEDI
jgi:hypothetical protein